MQPWLKGLAILQCAKNQGRAGGSLLAGALLEGRIEMVSSAFPEMPSSAVYSSLKVPSPGFFACKNNE